MAEVGDALKAAGKLKAESGRSANFTAELDLTDPQNAQAARDFV